MPAAAAHKEEVLGGTPTQELPAETEDLSLMAERAGANARQSAPAAAAIPKAARWIWICHACDEENNAERNQCNNCGLKRDGKACWVCKGTGKVGTEKCLTCNGTGQATSCLSRVPVKGDTVKRAARQEVSAENEQREGNAWKLHPDELAVVVDVDGDGDFKLQNPGGVVSVWQFRKFFVYQQAARWICPHCDEVNRAERNQCNNCGKASSPAGPSRGKGESKGAGQGSPFGKAGSPARPSGGPPLDVLLHDELFDEYFKAKRRRN